MEVDKRLLHSERSVWEYYANHCDPDAGLLLHEKEIRAAEDQIQPFHEDAELELSHYADPTITGIKGVY